MTVDSARDTDVVPSLQALESTQLAYLQRSDMAPAAYDEPLFAKFVYETCAKTAQAILNNIYFSCSTEKPSRTANASSIE